MTAAGRGTGRPTDFPIRGQAIADGPVSTSGVSPGMQRIQETAAAIVLAVAGVVLLVGWWGGVDLLTRLHPDLVSMKANTALGFLLAGTALLGAGDRIPHAAGQAAAAMLVLLGAATIFEYASGSSIGIDQLLADDTNLVATPYPGRMGLNTASGFVGLGTALLLGARRRPPTLRIAAQVLAGVAGLLAALAAVGYLLEATEATGLGSATQMAVHTSLLMILVATGIGAMTSDVGGLRVLTTDGVAGRLGRRLVPTAAGAIVLAAVSTRTLTAAGLLDDERLRLAFNVTAGLTTVLVLTLVVLHRLDRTENVLAESRRELESLVTAFKDLHLRIGPDDRVLTVHGEGHGLLAGTETGELADVLDHRIVVDVQATITVSRRSDQPATSTCRLGEGDAGRALEVRAVPLGGGAVAVAIRDVSALEAARNELKALNDDLEARIERRTEELRASNEELHAFAFTVANDVKSPLSSIRNLATMLAAPDGPADEQERQDLVQRIEGTASRLVEMIGGIIAYADPGSAQPTDLDPLDALAWARAMLQPELTAAEAKISARQLPRVHASPAALRTILVNLLGNCAKYRRPDVPLQIVVTGRSGPGDLATLRVSDNGEGIAEGLRRRLFDPAAPAPPDTGSMQGAGTGLRVVARLVEAVGGTCWVEDSDLDHGVAVCVALPLATTGRSSVRPAGQRGRRATSSSSGSSSPTP